MILSQVLTVVFHNEMNCTALSPDDNFRDTGMISCVIFHTIICATPLLGKVYITMDTSTSPTRNVATLIYVICCHSDSYCNTRFT